MYILANLASAYTHCIKCSEVCTLKTNAQSLISKPWPIRYTFCDQYLPCISPCVELHQLLKILPGELVHLSPHARQNGVTHEPSITTDGLDHDEAFLQCSNVALHHRLEDVGEAVDEELQYLGIVEAHDVVHEVEHQLAETHGGETEVDDASVVNEVAEVRDALVLHVDDDGCARSAK